MRPSELAADHAALCLAVREAGAAVLRRYRGRPVKSWTKDDASPVSEADIEANESLRWRLMAGGRRDYGWLSEESAEDPRRLDAERTWIVDPIDGTRAFLDGRPEFAVCAALVEHEEVQAAAIFNPVTDEFFEATRGGGARCNGAPIRASDRSDLAACRMLAWGRMFRHPDWPRPWPEMKIGYRNSTSYRMALVAKGAYDATLALVRKADWDIAPGALIAAEAGACASDHLGQPYRFNRVDAVQRALVCAAAPLYPAILARLDHLPADLRDASR